MSPSLSIHAWLRWTAALAIACFAVADGGLLVPAAATPVWLLAWLRPKTATDPRDGILPRSAVLALFLAVTGWAALAVYGAPENLVLFVSRAVSALVLIKLLDRRSARDRAQALGLCVFLAIGACLTTNSIWLGLLLLVFVPVLMRTSMLHQVASGEEARIDRLQGLRPADQRRLASLSAETQWGGGRALRGALLCSLAFAFVASIAVFVTAPRKLGFGVFGEWAAPPVGSVTGFSSEVRLGASGLLSESATPVLDLRVTDQSRADASSQFEHVYLRGAVLENYDKDSGRWRATEKDNRHYQSGNPAPGRSERVSRPARDLPVYTFRIEYRNRAPGPLFTVYRTVTIASDTHLPYLRDRDTLVIESDAAGRLACTLEAQIDAPLARQGDTNWLRRLPELFREGAIRAETDRVLAEAGLARDPALLTTPDDGRIVRALEQRLQNAYEYTTEMTAPNPGEDPIEMFLFRTRRGHCEYFASALAAMCRSVGIDARVVTGYVASERDEAGVFTVRESHAHAWVEARVEEFHWRTYDPSPAEGVAAAHLPPGGVLAATRSLLERLERLWIHSVVSYRTSPTEASRPPQWMRRLANRLAVGERRASPSEAQSEIASAAKTVGKWLGVFVIVAGAGVGAVMLAHYIARRLGARRARIHASIDDPTLPDRMRQAFFYSDLLDVLRKGGAPKPPWRPPLEHLSRLADARPGALGPGGRLVDLYYASRFGRRLLSDAEVEEARRLVREVQGALATGAHPASAVGSRHGP